MESGSLFLDCVESIHGLLEYVFGLRESIHGLLEYVFGLRESIHGLRECVSGLSESIHGCRECVSGLHVCLHARDPVTSRTAGLASRNDVRSMRRSILILLLLAGCSTPVPVRIGAHQAAAPQVMAVSNPALQEGNPFAGRRAFIALECIDCHRVAEDADLPRGRRAIAGPLLADMQRLKPHEVANRILSTSTGKGQDLLDKEMKDYAQPITNRQLVDIVAYLRHPPASGRG